jgi:hypothetical protein
MSPVTGESTKETVKTIACGNAGRFRCTRCYSCAFYHSKCTRDRGCSGPPAFPTPSFGREIKAQLGRLAPRGRSRIRNYINVIARSNATKQSIRSLRGEMDCFVALLLAMTALEFRRLRWGLDGDGLERANGRPSGLMLPCAVPLGMPCRRMPCRRAAIGQWSLSRLLKARALLYRRSN